MKLKNKRLAIQAQQNTQRIFFKLVVDFRRSEDPKEIRRLGDKLGKVVLGEWRPRKTPASEGGRYIKRRGRRKAAPA